MWSSRVRSYSAAWDRASNRVIGLEAWAEQVIEDLWVELQAGVPVDESEPASLPGAEADREPAAEFLEEKRRDFVGQEELLASVRKFISADQPKKRPFGLILCSGKNKEQVELRQLNNGEIRVAEYPTALPSKSVLTAKLHDAVTRVREQMARREMPELGRLSFARAPEIDDTPELD